jgi:nucleoside-diphosphate-sugar epimerase
MRSARVLVTGAEGLVGSVLSAHLQDCGHEVIALAGDARDKEAVTDAVKDVDAVAHLAAIANPWHESPYELFGNNVVATFTVLWAAAEHGVRRLVIASSVNATGLLVNPAKPRPTKYPINETTNEDLADPYSLSKHVDEDTLRAVCRRFGASGVALRLPLIIAPDNEAPLRAWAAREPGANLGDGWGWLDVRDAAEVFRLALESAYEGAHVVHVAAEHVFVDRPTEELLDEFAPGVPRETNYPGRNAPIDTSRARELLGFLPKYGEQ